MPSCASRWRLKAVNRPCTPSSCSCILVVHAQCVWIVFLPHSVQDLKIHSMILSVCMKLEAYCLPFLPLVGPMGVLQKRWKKNLGKPFGSFPFVGGCLPSSVPRYCVHFWRPGAVVPLSRWPPCQIHLNFRSPCGETPDFGMPRIGQCLRLVMVSDCEW